MNCKNSALQITGPAVLLLFAVLFSGCLTSKKLDRFVAKQYGQRLPAAPRQKNKNITVTSALPFSSNQISSSVAKSSHVLPLLFYWHWDYKVTCALNTAIATHYFTNALYAEARRKLAGKLHGHELKLSIEQVPHVFSWDDNEHMIWAVVYGIGWEKVSIQPEIKDMVVSYQLLQDGTVIKSGKIDVPDNESDKKLGWFESWKRATSTYIARYNHDMASMARTFVTELAEEL